MNDLNFVLYSLKYRMLNSMLSILLTAFGVSIALIISQFGDHIKKRLTLDGKGIDIVVGAKGSPLQLILSSVYHIDIPTGNIDYKLAKKITRLPEIKKSIPLALGDNWKGYRIVGTTKEYIQHYNAKIDKGRLWNNKFETVIGSSIDLKINDEFIGAHGLLEEGTPHHDNKYKVIGILKKTGTVLDRLIITSLDSVLEIHGLENIESKNAIHEHKEHGHEKSVDKHKDTIGVHENHEHKDTIGVHENHEHKNTIEKHEDHEHKNTIEKHEDHEHKNTIEKHEDHEYKNTIDKHEDHEHKNTIDKHEDHEHKNTIDKHDSLKSPEVSALLISTKSPISNINLPRLINRESSLQAANPALEITRLISMLGLGSKSFTVISIILILISALSIFAGLAGNMENRIGDLSVLRAIGYSKKRIFKIVALEGIMIVITGLIFGIIMGLLSFMIIAEVITPLNTSQASISLSLNFYLIILIVLFTGLVAALFPAYYYSKLSVAKLLSKIR